MVNKKITLLMNQEMDRKGFLKYSGGVLLALVGVTGLINTLLKLGDSRSNITEGYGSAPYGG